MQETRQLERKALRMRMIRITCPACHIDSQMSIKDDLFYGPFVCWKCKKKMILRIEHQQVTECTPIDDDEYYAQLNANHIRRY